jgi:hypothetical protein
MGELQGDLMRGQGIFGKDLGDLFVFVKSFLAKLDFVFHYIVF